MDFVALRWYQAARWLRKLVVVVCSRDLLMNLLKIQTWVE